MFQSTKIIDGFSTCFRQEASAPIHCSKLHGYAISFKLTFQGELDHRQWVQDYGFMKRSKTIIDWNVLDYEGGADWREFTIDEWFKFIFDHTVVLARNDSQLLLFRELHNNRALSLRVVEHVGCERFAELVYKVLSEFLHKETDSRVHLLSVECIENSKNSSLFFGSK